jgi:hypothetical protein
VDTYAGYNLATVNSAAVNMDKQVSLMHADLVSFGYILWSDTVGSYRNSFFRDSQTTDFHSGQINL